MDFGNPLADAKHNNIKLLYSRLAYGEKGARARVSDDSHIIFVPLSTVGVLTSERPLRLAGRGGGGGDGDDDDDGDVPIRSSQRSFLFVIARTRPPPRRSYRCTPHSRGHRRTSAAAAAAAVFRSGNTLNTISRLFTVHSE